jgi:hypothetical protein
MAEDRGFRPYAGRPENGRDEKVQTVAIVTIPDDESVTTPMNRVTRREGRGRRDSSEPPKSSSGNDSARNAGLTICALAIATQIPTTLAQVKDPMIRAFLEMGAIIIVFALGYFTTRKAK